MTKCWSCDKTSWEPLLWDGHAKFIINRIRIIVINKMARIRQQPVFIWSMYVYTSRFSRLSMLKVIKFLNRYLNFTSIKCTLRAKVNNPSYNLETISTWLYKKKKTLSMMIWVGVVDQHKFTVYKSCYIITSDLFCMQWRNLPAGDVLAEFNENNLTSTQSECVKSYRWEFVPQVISRCISVHVRHQVILQTDTDTCLPI